MFRVVALVDEKMIWLYPVLMVIVGDKTKSPTMKGKLVRHAPENPVKFKFLILGPPAIVSEPAVIDTSGAFASLTEHSSVRTPVLLDEVSSNNLFPANNVVELILRIVVPLDAI
jgi:hypothetical protein